MFCPFQRDAAFAGPTRACVPPTGRREAMLRAARWSYASSACVPTVAAQGGTVQHQPQGLGQILDSNKWEASVV